MFTYQHYVPIIKAQDGELAALSELDENTAEKLTPMLVFSSPRNTTKALTKAQLEDYLEDITRQTNGKWPFKQPIFVDLLCLDIACVDGIDPIEYIFSELENQNIPAIPVVTFGCTEEFKNQVAAVCKKYQRGACIRIIDQDYGVISIQNLLTEMSMTLGCKIEEIDILLDYKTVHSSLQYAIFASALYRLSALPHLLKWRTVTIAGVSFPTYIKQVREILNQIPRVEWNIWLDILKTPVKRIPSFGDYDTFHPVHPDRDPRETAENPSLRYTIENAWLILNEKDIDKLSPKEFQAICKELVASSAFCGKDFSWGDDFIYKVAHGKESVDKNDLWRKACTNHHVTFVTGTIKKI